jgi:hypothetical protein
MEAAMYRTISVEGFSNTTTEFKPGPVPMLQWVEIRLLVVDPEYQREIGKRGRININRIVEEFCWSKFAPVIVAPIEGGKFAIVDGQHRVTAAMVRGITSVPCQVIQADRVEQAAAYAAVNGNVTYTTPAQLYYARLTAGDPATKELQKICAAAEVTIIRRNLLSVDMRKGETQAVAAMRRCLKHYGATTLITSLQCITQTGDGNPGYVRAYIFEAICETLYANQAWRDAGEQLFRSLDNFSFPDRWDEANEKNRKGGELAPPIKAAFAELFHAHLLNCLGSPERGLISAAA